MLGADHSSTRATSAEQNIFQADRDKNTTKFVLRPKMELVELAPFYTSHQESFQRWYDANWPLSLRWVEQHGEVAEGRSTFSCHEKGTKVQADTQQRHFGI